MLLRAYPNIYYRTQKARCISMQRAFLLAGKTKEMANFHDVAYGFL